MCLADISKRKIAKKDIVCYKIFTPNILSPNTYRTFYQNFYWPEKLVRSDFTKGYTNNTIEKGLHAFVYLKDAKNFAKNRSSRAIVKKMIIPKGSYYYVGRFLYYDSIASNKMYMAIHKRKLKL